MQLKIATHYLLVSCFVSCIIAKAVFPGGCYECEEEVWEEVPCDEIPSNSTTISPPATCQCNTTPRTTTMTPVTTTIETTTTPETTIATTTMPITTTPMPMETTTPKNSFKKCYCECKVGCKEFCRRVIVNPDPKIQIVQVSKITEPVAEGLVEYTHFHQRELLQKPKYLKNYEISSDLIPQISASNEITENNDYTNKYSTSTQATPVTPYKEAIVIEPRRYASLNTKISFNNYPAKPKVSYYTTTPPTPAPSHPVYETPYDQDEIISNNLYTQKTKHQPPPINYYRDPESYEFPETLEDIFMKISRTEKVPAGNTGLVYKDSGPLYSYSNSHSSSYPQPPYAPPASVKVSQHDSNVYIPQYEDNFNTFINEFLNGNPSNAAPYESYYSPFYSVSYSR